jgi:hypothetical protein
MSGDVTVMRVPGLLRLALLCGSVVFVFLLANADSVRADRVVNANEPVVISDDITNLTTSVVSSPGNSSPPASPGSGGNQGTGNPGGGNSNNSGNDNNRSGFGDGSNPGQGASHSNSGNQGTGNPNNSGGNR